MTGNDITATQMVWRAKLIRLTQIGLPELDNGRPTTYFIDPGLIIQIYRTVVKFKDKHTPAGVPDGAGILHEEFGQVPATAVVAIGGGLHVVESPEQVMQLRELAFGHKFQPKSV